MARLVSAVRGADAVLSAVGARSNALAGVVSRGTKAIIWAMREARVRRLVVVSAAPVRTTASPDRPYPPEPDPEDGVFYKYVIDPLIRLGLRPRLRDLARMEDALWNSGLNWTGLQCSRPVSDGDPHPSRPVRPSAVTVSGRCFGTADPS